ncbi:MAG TPA: class I SAM-dependent methyltransferase [Trebonia sp.]|jgi:SAM-dependent methyltransferase
MAVARYDGHADWYDDWRKQSVEGNALDVRGLLGPGEGPCLDLGCGTGLFLDALAATGRTVVGVDCSADQLRIARARSPLIVQADAAELPFGDTGRRPQARRDEPPSLADMLNAFVRSGLLIDHVAEAGDRPVPNTLAIRARKAA